MGREARIANNPAREVSNTRRDLNTLTAYMGYVKSEAELDAMIAEKNPDPVVAAEVKKLLLPMIPKKVTFGR